MPFCPICKYEYIEGIKQCPDCDVALIDQLPVSKLTFDENQELVDIARFSLSMDAELARMRLETAGIECAIVNNVMPRINTIIQTIPIKLLVRAEDAERAVEVLQETNP